jgi:hypothetical protein
MTARCWGARPPMPPRFWLGLKNQSAVYVNRGRSIPSANVRMPVALRVASDYPGVEEAARVLAGNRVPTVGVGPVNTDQSVLTRDRFEHLDSSTRHTEDTRRGNPADEGMADMPVLNGHCGRGIERMGQSDQTSGNRQRQYAECEDGRLARPQPTHPEDPPLHSVARLRNAVGVTHASWARKLGSLGRANISSDATRRPPK